MATRKQSVVLGACKDFMKPLVRLLLRNGVGYREFSEICKAAFVDVASSEYGIRGRKTNMSRVAVMTGLSRKDVKKVRDAGEHDQESPSAKMRSAESVLSIWHSNPDFLDINRRPKRITFEGLGATFRNLVALAGGDIPPRAMLTELLRAGSVIQEGEKLRAVSQSYVPEPNNPEAVLLAGVAIKHLVSTLDHNLSCQSEEERYLERRVYSDRLPKSQGPRFKRLAREKGQLLLSDLSSWLTARESTGSGDSDDNHQATGPGLGVGVYFFQEEEDRQD